ncbi:MAG: endopeptidase La [Lachnospiraceae bacterium]
MIVVPSYGTVIVPGVTYYFQKSYFEEIAGTEVKENEDVVFAVLKENKERNETKETDFYPIGAFGHILNKDEQGTVSIKVTDRVDINKISIADDVITVEFAKRMDVPDENEKETGTKFQELKADLLKFVNRYQWGIMARNYIMHWNTIDEMAAAMSQYLYISSEEKYRMLETDSVSERHQIMEKAIYELMEVASVSDEAQKKQSDMNEQILREDAIRKQMNVLQKELDEMHPESMSDIRKFELKIENAGMNDDARKEAEKILNRMKQEGENSHEYGMLYDYLDFVTSLSWKKEELADIDLRKAEKILDEEHYGLKKVKQRIIEQIAVMKLNQKQSGSILLFVGEPGTGKTSIGQSVAKALGRKYVRVSLGGIRDEAEIRGHRRTYVGAMPGRIMEGIKRSGVSNPVVVLDEVDKLVKAFDGDPSSALLEVLDPEQNAAFTDHYMNVPYDLSDVLFICTANSTETIPEPLLNRMEVIEFQGYTENEKVTIAKKHLLPKAMKNSGIRKQDLRISEKAIRTIISDYTMESGVRGLKKRLDSLCRKTAVAIVKGETEKISISNINLKEYLDMRSIHHDKAEGKKKPGVITGLAWTQAGGDILFMESMFTKGEGKVIITGQLGDVMKESVQIAVSLVKAMYPESEKLFQENDVHIHVPAGATPKDGPSAGITLTTALASLVTGKAVSPKYAMTGEVSLQGGVMPIGGLPEKLLAAVRAGVKTVFIPKENEDDLEEVAEEVKTSLEIITVSKCEDVLRYLKLL